MDCHDEWKQGYMTNGSAPNATWAEIMAIKEGLEIFITERLDSSHIGYQAEYYKKSLNSVSRFGMQVSNEAFGRGED